MQPIGLAQPPVHGGSPPTALWRLHRQTQVPPRALNLRRQPSRERSKKTMTNKQHRSIAYVLIGASAASILAGCVVAPPPEHHASRAPAPAQVVVVQAAPAQVRTMPAVIVEERGAPPSPGWHWVNGYWRWAGNDWLWEKGHWVANAVPPMPKIIVEERIAPPSPQHYWVPGHWVWRNDIGNWSWVQGRWLK